MQHFCTALCYDNQGIKTCGTSSTFEQMPKVNAVLDSELILMQSIMDENDSLDALHEELKSQLEVLNLQSAKLTSISMDILNANDRITGFKNDLIRSLGPIREKEHPNQMTVSDQIGRDE